MGQSRSSLQSILKDILGSDNVYFQPPNGLQMKYPCIVYKRDDMEIMFANDKPYNSVKRYQIMVIDQDPDSVIPDKIGLLPMCSYERFFTADNLNHDVFNIFF